MAMIANTVSITNLFNESSVYVIPTFQRPYAWEKTQWDEIVEDIRNATQKTSPYHYFAPLHVVKIVNPENDLWRQYTDDTNEDIVNLAKSRFRNAHGSINVFLVIDGQQRLITFYSILHQYNPRFVTLSNGLKIPGVILNSQSDHITFRNLLGLNSPYQSVNHVSRAQSRLKLLFDKFGTLKAGDPCFSRNNPCYNFITDNGCEILCVQLDASARLAAFMTLNDRGKPLTNLEKTKSLFMEIDDNCSTPHPHEVNNAFGYLYQSLEAHDAYIDDDEFLRQIGIMLWEGGNLAQISGTVWPASELGKNRNNSIHQIGPNLLYEDYFKKIPSGIAANFLHNEILSEINVVTNNHDHLIKMIAQAKTGSPLNCQSFTQGMGFGMRDAISDYQAVLLSLRLQSKQIAFLFATRQLFPSKEWHDPLGFRQIDNRSIKQELASRLAVIEQENHNIPNIDSMIVLVRQEINEIPDTVNRGYTALQIAEALRLIVENSKPGGFSGTWNNTFRSTTPPSPQSFVDHWIYYLETRGYRDGFIVYRIARSTDAYNSNPWVEYFVREYDYCITGRDAHRNPNFQIEHFFPSSWGDVKYLSDVTRHGFSSCELYKQSFVDQIGNKLVLDESLNKSIINDEPSRRVTAYITQASGTVNVMNSNPSESAIRFGKDISGNKPPDIYRVYVQLRSLHLAAFAARRF